MKTEPMEHQTRGCQRMLEHDRKFFAMGAEQGTGKTWMLLRDFEHAATEEGVTALLVIAPKGVHINWVKREIPKHCVFPCWSVYWVSGAGKRKEREVQDLLKKRFDGVKILAMNIDAIVTNKGRAIAAEFLNARRAMMIVDESQRIKNPSSARTKKTHALGADAAMRRISSGTLIADKPIDIWGQFEFLRHGLLGTKSYRAFVAEYSELLPATSPIVQEAMRNARRGGTPQIIKRDENGMPIYRNLDKLRSMIAPHTFRVLKSECLDLPEKVYQQHFYELTPAVRRVYEQVRKDARWHRDDGDIDTFNALTVINKLRQVAAGFILEDGEPREIDSDETARVNALRTVIEDHRTEGCPVLVWASHRAEIAKITRELRADGMKVAEYHGGTPEEERETAIDALQCGHLDALVANPASAGTGLDLSAARLVVYYSCTWSLEQRSQSEDRVHRHGLGGTAVYVDLVALDTIDERVASALQHKRAAEQEIMAGI